MEALPAEVQVVLPGKKIFQRWKSNTDFIPGETMAVAASLALARPSTKLARPWVRNVVVTHPGGCCSSAHSETKALCEDLLNFSENIVGLKVSEEEGKNFSSQAEFPVSSDIWVCPDIWVFKDLHYRHLSDIRVICQSVNLKQKRTEKGCSLTWRLVKWGLSNQIGLFIVCQRHGFITETYALELQGGFFKWS